MNNNPSINHRQLAWLTSSMVTSVGILSMHSIHIRILSQDAWYTYFLPLCYLFVIASFFMLLIRLFPGKHLFEVNLVVFGRFVGTCVNILFAVLIWLIVIKDVYTLGAFASSSLLSQTPLEFILLLFAFILLIYGQKNIEVMTRVNDIFYPLFVISLLLMPILLANQITLSAFEPIQNTSIRQWFTSNVLAAGSLGDVFVLGVFMHALSNGVQFRSAIRYGATLGISMLTLVIALEIAVLGAHIPAQLVYPVYTLIQLIQITEFMDRVDLILFSIWLPTLTCKIVATYLALILGVQSIFKTALPSTLNKPLAMWVAVSAYFAFDQTSGLLSFVHFTMPVLSLTYQFLLVCSVVILVYLKKYFTSFHSLRTSLKLASSIKITSPGDTRLRSSIYVWIAMSMCSIGIGWLLSDSHPWYSRICAIAYGLTFVILIYLSYAQMKISLISDKK